MSSPLKLRVSEWLRELQNTICSGLESVEPVSRFVEKNWERPGGGGGLSRVLSGGKVFEKGGVNFSEVHGELSNFMVEKLGAKSKVFYAMGLSLVIHPHSPFVPTIHANFRYFEQPDRSWFGGGTDLTPYVPSEEDFRHFHRVLKSACDSYTPDAYARYKKQCDEYFFIAHRSEARGIGGIFFDYETKDLEKFFEFVKRCGNSFLESYLPIVKSNKDKSFTDRQKKFQLLRRGRYVEFNLVQDRGTLFGLQTKGNIESILMSLPPVVHFDYSPDLELNDDEKELMNWFRNPREWA